MAWHRRCRGTEFGAGGAGPRAVPGGQHHEDVRGYLSWSFSTEDGHRQATVALTPNFNSDPDDAVDAFLDKAICT